MGNGAAERKMIRIVDVVGGYEYTLDDQSKVAHRVMVQVAQPMAKRAGTGATGSTQWFNTQAVVSPALVATQVAPAAAVLTAIPSAAPPPPGRIPRPEMQSEDLGTQMIEGVTARGTRTTQTWPVDSVGNDRPIVSVHETWFSQQLGGIVVLSKNTDPRYGETTTALKNVNLAEPDPSLFQPPPGYQIEDANNSSPVPVPYIDASPAQSR
jgi:hypothetical protein